MVGLPVGGAACLRLRGEIEQGVLLLALTSILGTMANLLPIAAIGALAAGVLFFFGVFDLISGIGLIKRTKSGWWLCVLGLSWAFFDRGSGVVVRCVNRVLAHCG